jgi:5,10-methylenetetrahydromethanopterin reductase
MELHFALLPDGPARATADLVRQAEALGYTTAWLPDQAYYRDPFVLMTACAQATRRIRIGLCLTNPYTRHPVLIARAIGVVDEVADGRALLALGAANRRHVLAKLGLDPSGAERRIREALLVIRRLLAGERVSYQSPTLYLDDVQLDFRPRPDLPLWIGTKGPRVLALAGEVADGVVIEGHCTPAGMDDALAHVARGAARAGRDLAALPVVAWQVVWVGDDPRPVLERLKPWVALLMSTATAAALAHLGFAADTVARVHADWAAGGGELAARHLTADDVRRMTLVGTPAEVAAAIDALATRGVRAVAALLRGSYDEIALQQRRLAEEVRPRLRG